MEALTWIERIKIEDFGCVKRVDLSLSRLHALIGPNDSGKSTILRAIQSSEPQISTGRVSQTDWYAAEIPEGSYPEGDYQRLATKIIDALGDKAILRLDPDVLRAATKLRPSSKDLWFSSDRGEGLAGLYDALLSRDRKAFTKLENKFIELFPTVEALRLETVEESAKSLGLTLTDGRIVDAKRMSEGMLYWLAFAIVEHLSPKGVLLVEEPENGLHPSRIREVMQALRKISEQTQIVLATHSPLVINELQPEEVTIVTRTPARGTICTPMTQTKNFKERAKVYALGELWLSYADGDLEEELVGDGTEAVKE